MNLLVENYNEFSEKSKETVMKEPEMFEETDKEEDFETADVAVGDEEIGRAERE